MTSAALGGAQDAAAAGTANSTLWRYPAISGMLTNEMYIGNMVQGRYGSVSYKTKQNRPRPRDQWYRVEGTHKPIIGRDLWERVQAMLRERARPFDTGTVGLFAGTVLTLQLPVVQTVEPFVFRWVGDSPVIEHPGDGRLAVPLGAKDEYLPHHRRRFLVDKEVPFSLRVLPVAVQGKGADMESVLAAAGQYAANVLGHVL